MITPSPRAAMAGLPSIQASFKTTPLPAIPGTTPLPAMLNDTATPTSKAPPAIPTDPAKLRDAARAFEAMAIGALITPMFETVDPSQGPFGGGAGEAAWRPMMIEHMAKKISESGGLGLARPILDAMLRMQEAKSS